MRSTSIPLLAALVAGVLAAPAVHQTSHVIHEKRDSLPPGWEQSHKLSADSVLPMRVALSQSNLEKIEEYLMDVSAPDSENWGKHWPSDKIAETFAPSADTVHAVRDWLIAAGIDGDRVRHSGGQGWLHFNATVAEAEKLLHADYHMYEHKESGTKQIACTSYKLPEDIKQHVDFVLPTVQFDAQIIPRAKQAASRTARALVKRDDSASVDAIQGFSPVVNQGKTFVSAGSLAKSLKNCTEYITPACLRALYEIPVPTDSGVNNPLGIVEYTPQSYWQPDLDLFFSAYSTKQKQTSPNLASIDGGFVNTVSLGFGYNGESNLDLQYSMSLGNPIPVMLYQVGDAVEGGSFNTFLDAIDGSYCTFEGGDAGRDPKYPDPRNRTGAYKGPEACGTFKPQKVISTSYSYGSEYDLPVAYMQRQCAEYAKLGLAGTSLLYSSGDSGVSISGTVPKCLLPNSTFGSPHFGITPTSRFTVGFPGNCPYVTGVGATQVKNNTSVLDTDPEEAADIPLDQGPGEPPYVFSSGGGFSDLFGVPAYQKAAVKKYFKNFKPSYSSLRYNDTGLSRGVPDISANGANYVISVNETFSLVYGTSASAPTFATIIAIINEQRHAQGKGPIGFINPSLYANADVLTDITEGNNPNCNTDGFTAVAGWDPLTGLGTPNVPRMLELFLKMA